MDQEEMIYSAHKQIMVRIHTFNAIQSGPNPLSKEEIKILAEKNPRIWAQFVKE